MHFFSKTFLLFIFISLSISAAEAQQVIRGPYLQLLRTDGVTVCFRTDQPAVARITYGTDMNNLDRTQDGAGVETDHFVTLSGLQPYTKYYYTVGTQGQVLEGPDTSQFFITSLETGSTKPMRIWAIGDFGKGNTQQGEVRSSYVDYSKDKHTDVWLWLGDNAYNDGTDQEYQDKVFSGPNGYETILPNMPFWPTPGNHDYQIPCQLPCFTQDPTTIQIPYYDIVHVPTQAEAGGQPSQTEIFYSFDYGNVHFISINSEAYAWTNDPNSILFDWIEADLDSNKQEWTIAFWHQPPYSKGSHDSDDFFELLMAAMRENVAPVMEKHGVDIVVSGHSHVYERSFLIKDHTGASGSWDANTMLVDGGSGNFEDGEHYEKTLTGPNAGEGTIYIVCGNSGSDESNPDLDHPTTAFGDGGDGISGSLVIDVHGNRLDGMYLRSSGVVLDTFTIIKPDGTPPDTTTSVRNLATEFTNVTVYPNPFDQSAQLEFTLKQRTEINVSLYSINGQLIGTFMEGEQTAGKHSITINADALNLSQGNYLVRLAKGNEVQVEKVLKLK